MLCSQCGKEVQEGDQFCAFCGNKIEAEPVEQKKGKKLLILCLLLVVILSVVGGLGVSIAGKLQEAKKMQELQRVEEEQQALWEEWINTYKQEMAGYYLEQEEKVQLEAYILSVGVEESSRQQLKNEMIAFKEQVINNNMTYVETIEKGLEELDDVNNWLFAYDEEIEELNKSKEAIRQLKEAKQYPEALAKIEECLAFQQEVQEVKTGWVVNVVQKDITQYPKVKLYIDIKDGSGNPVENLDQKVFFLSQKDATNGEYVKKEIINAVQLNEKESININLVADLSDSMSGNLEPVKGIMSNFLNTVQFGVGDQTALTGFSDTSFILQQFTSNKNSILQQIMGMQTYGGTKLYDTLIEATLNVQAQSGAKCVIAFTDGLDNRSVSTVEEVISVAKRTGIPIFIIGIGDSIDHTVLSHIANSTGGYYTNVSSIDDTMQTIYNAIYTRQKQVYCLEYQADETSLKNIQDLKLYLRGETAGGATEYTYTPSDDFFNILLNNFLNSYIRALTQGEPSIMAQAGYVSLDGNVYAQTKSYIEDNVGKLTEQLLQAKVTQLNYIDSNTYEITTEEVYDVQQIKDYNTEVAKSTNTTMQTVKSMLLSSYSESTLKGRAVTIHKQIILRGHYQIKKSAEGKWQINNFTSSYENLGTTVYTVYIEGMSY